MHKIGRYGLLVACVFGALAACQAARAGDYSDREYQENSSALVDAVNRDYPPDTSGNINDPRILRPLRRNESATVLLDEIQRHYPTDTSGTISDPRIPNSIDGDESATELLDTVNELYPPTLP